MPSHVYHPRRQPPTLWDRLLVHPMDNPVALLCSVAGAVLVFSTLMPHLDIGPFNDITGTVAVTGTGLAMMIGGALALLGLHWNGDNVSLGWRLERAGWILVAGGSLSYTIAVISTNPANILAWLATLAIHVGAVLEVYSRWRIERDTRERGDKLKTEGMEL